MLTSKQKQILAYTRAKVKKYFKDNFAAGHGFDHAVRVSQNAALIAQKEKADVFLCALSAWLHDLGRAESGVSKIKARHHEISYNLCRQWFKRDPVLSRLKKAEKLIILYAVRYHWNDAADKYKEAIILRDADKLDIYGSKGLERVKEVLRHGENLEHVRLIYFYTTYWLRTKTARQLTRQKKLFKPGEKFFLQTLKKEIKPVRL